jgi:ParB family chromosome partitioning protein
MQVAVETIKPNPLQPRTKNPVVTDLVDSMAKVGLVQPIIVAKQGDGYMLIAGHRRLAAAKRLKWAEIEADIVNLADPKFDIARIMAENEVRTDLTGKERVLGFQTMIEHGWSDKDMSAVTAAPYLREGGIA